MTKKEVLIIDDSNTSLVLLESLLKRYGYKVISASNGMQGLDLLKKNTPDLIFLDLKMPVLDGFEFLEKVRKNGDYINIPIVILSAATDSESIKRGVELGVTDYLSKPLDPEKVIELTKSILSDRVK